MVMKTYVALLRGIGPINPNMRPAKLKEAFEAMGFKQVRTVISSGNVVFSSPSASATSLEQKIEKALPKLLGFTSTTIIRSEEEMAALVKKYPAKGIVHGERSYILVTFLKDHSAKLRSFPRQGTGFRVLGIYKREICVVIDTKSTETPNLMLKFEKEFGKAITSRTWNTVERINKKMEVKHI